MENLLLLNPKAIPNFKSNSWKRNRNFHIIKTYLKWIKWIMNAFFDRNESLSPQKPSSINLSVEKTRAHLILYYLIVAATVTIGLSSAKRFEVVQNYSIPDPFQLKPSRVCNYACVWMASKSCLVPSPLPEFHSRYPIRNRIVKSRGRCRTCCSAADF